MKNRQEVDVGSAAGKKKILIMDDEIMIGEIASQMLSFLGCESLHVTSGEDAIAVYRQHRDKGEPFDVVIMDLTVPGGMGGSEAVVEILAIDPQARVLVSSGYSNNQIMTNFADYGFRGVVEKPFDMHSLQEAIEAVL